MRKNKTIFLISISFLLTSCTFHFETSSSSTESIGSSTNLVSSVSSTESINSQLSSSSISSLISSSSQYFPDPYIGVSHEEFYSSYKKATSNLDAYYRSQHGFLSGDLDVPNKKEPTIATNQPKTDGLYDKNLTKYYTYNAENEPISYKIVDSNNNVVNEIFKSGAYVSLEEVAAYIWAFNDIPSNYTSKKSGNPSNSIWGKYLRLNHSIFLGDVEKYPYEPILPDIDGAGGFITYYELDIGDYSYNNGKRINRGTCRIVYTRYYNTSTPMEVLDSSNRHVFYTYNHYNDFQEYLNYENGWGEIFGNITGGGKLNSTTDYNPTPYVEVNGVNF